MFWKALVLDILALGWSIYSWNKYHKYPVLKNPALVVVTGVVVVLGVVSIAVHHLV